MSNIATLTTSWQQLGSAKLDTNITIYLDGKYSEQSVENNITTVQFRLRSGGNSWRTQSGTAKFTGAYTDSKSCATYPNYITDNATIYSISKTVRHNTDGTKSLSIGGQVTANIPSTKTATISNRTVTIPKIDRLAIVTSATDFTDEGNPTLEFDNPAGFDVYPYLNFYDNDNTVVKQFAQSPQSGDTPVESPYTWNLTNEQRAELRSATNQQSAYRVQVGVTTYDSGTQLGYNSIAKQMTYVNATPTQAITTTETNATIVSLLGSSSASTIVQNASNLTFAITPTALKSATISKVELNGVPDTTSPYEFTNIIPTTNTFNVKTTDSRGLYAEETITKTLINYEPIDILSVTFERPSPTSDDVVLNAELKYFQVTFGSTPNVPTIKWKKGETGQENTLSSSDYTIDTQNNKITITNLTLINAISYQDEARFYFYVNDLLTQDEDSHNYVTKGFPVFELGEHDAQVNGNFFIADTNGQNRVNVGDTLSWLSTQKILWSGAYYMNGNQTADLDEEISKQPNGIVLVWSAYENGQAKNWDWVLNFIPKKFVETNISISGGGLNFNMNTVTYNHVGSKYLYFGVDNISGHVDNEAHSTGSGITYDNRYWVLRYVIGV